MKKRDAPELNSFQFVILVLSVFVLVVLAIELLVEVPPEVARVLRWIDNAVCGVFLVDFVTRFRRAPSKLQFMKWGWIDLLASTPEIAFLRWGRVFRIFRLLRLIRGIRSLREFFRIMYASRAQGGAASAAVITFLVLSLSSVGILFAERDPQSNIKTAGDAVWWSVTTITTVGYGDRFPVTTAGRIIAACLMFTGVGLFGTFSGVIATTLLGSGNKPEAASSGTEPAATDKGG